MTKVQHGNDSVNEIVAAKDRAQIGAGFSSWFKWLRSVVTCRQSIGAYIMTIGVVDECRRLGLGTKLIERTIAVLNCKWPLCEVLYLHVVSYNESAIRFYLNERNKFIRLKTIKDHYVIYEKNYDAVLLYKDIGGGMDV